MNITFISYFLLAPNLRHFICFLFVIEESEYKLNKYSINSNITDLKVKSIIYRVILNGTFIIISDPYLNLSAN